MELSITFRDTHASPALQDRIRQKVEKLKKYFIKATRGHVILKAEGLSQVAELTLSEDHHTFFAEAAAPDLYQATDAAITKMERQLREHKERVRKGHHLQ